MREITAVVIERLKCLLELHVRVVTVTLQHVVDLVQVLLQLVHDLGQGIAGVHTSTMVGLESSDVEAGFVIPHGQEIIQSIVRQRLHGGRGAVPGCLQCILVWGNIF